MLLNGIYREFHGATVHVAVTRRVVTCCKENYRSDNGSSTYFNRFLRGGRPKVLDPRGSRCDCICDSISFLYLNQIYREIFFYFLITVSKNIIHDYYSFKSFFFSIGNSGNEITRNRYFGGVCIRVCATL